MPDSPTPLPDATPAAPNVPRLPVAAVCKGLGDPVRWAILRELAAGEPRMVVEMARKIGKSPTLISKHLGVLRQTGMVGLRQRLHFIPPQFLPEPGRRVADFGRCLLRFD